MKRVAVLFVILSVVMVGFVSFSYAKTKKEIVRLRLNHAVSPLEQPHKLGLLRKDVARLLTILGQRALSEQK